MGGTAISLVTIPFWSPCAGRGRKGFPPSLKKRSQQISVQVPNFLMFQRASEIRNEYDVTEILVWFHVLSRRTQWLFWVFVFFCKLAEFRENEQESFTFQEEWHALWKAASDSWRTPPTATTTRQGFIFWKTGNLTVLWLFPWKRGEGLIRIAPEKYPPPSLLFFGRNKNPWKINK